MCTWYSHAAVRREVHDGDTGCVMGAGLWAVIQAMGVDEVELSAGHPGGGSRRNLLTVGGRKQAHGGDRVSCSLTNDYSHRIK